MPQGFRKTVVLKRRKKSVYINPCRISNCEKITLKQSIYRVIRAFKAKELKKKIEKAHADIVVVFQVLF